MAGGSPRGKWAGTAKEQAGDGCSSRLLLLILILPCLQYAVAHAVHQLTRDQRGGGAPASLLVVYPGSSFRPTVRQLAAPGTQGTFVQGGPCHRRSSIHQKSARPFSRRAGSHSSARFDPTRPAGPIRNWTRPDSTRLRQGSTTGGELGDGSWAAESWCNEALR